MVPPLISSLPTLSPMHMENNQIPIPEQASPGLPRPALDIGVPGCSSRRATGPNQQQQRRKWTREDNISVMECYYLSQPNQRGYRKRMHTIWQNKNPNSNITEQRLLNQKRSIEKNKLLTHVECQQIANKVRDDDITAIMNEENQENVNMAQSTTREEEEQEMRASVNEAQLNEEEEQIKRKITDDMRKYSEHETRPFIRKPPLNHETWRWIAKVNTVISTIEKIGRAHV